MHSFTHSFIHTLIYSITLQTLAEHLGPLWMPPEQCRQEAGGRVLQAEGTAGAEAPRVGVVQSGLARSAHRGLPGAAQPSPQSILELFTAAKGTPVPVCGDSLLPSPRQLAVCFLSLWIHLFRTFCADGIAITYDLRGLASVTEHHIVKVHPCCSRCWGFTPLK